MVFGSFTESVFFIRLTDHGCSSQSLGHEDAYLPDCKIYIVESLQSRCIFAGLKSIFKLVPRHWLWLMVLQIRASHGELDETTGETWETQYFEFGVGEGISLPANRSPQSGDFDPSL